MSDPAASRFAPQKQTTHERLSTTTVGLVVLSDFRKRRAEVLEQQEREAREAALSGLSTPDRSLTSTPDHAGSDSGGPPARKKKKKKRKGVGGRKLLSFGGGDDGDDGDNTESNDQAKTPAKTPGSSGDVTANTAVTATAAVKANAAVAVPRAVTTAALRKEAAEREALRREFLAVQEAVKATEMAIPFVFYDGAHIPGGTVRLKKGDFIWLFLDKSRKVGTDKPYTKRGWARAAVDDLMFVRDAVIIPHHYDFYFFVMNKIVGPSGRLLFDYSAEAPARPADLDAPKAAATPLPDIGTLEGANDDPKVTKVVDRRWYERNKHIYPASTWQRFDPEEDYTNQIRKDTGGNTFFFSR